MQSPSFLGSLISTIVDRGRELLSSRGARSRVIGGSGDPDLADLCATMLSGRGEATGVALALAVQQRWKTLNAAQRRDFLLALARRFGPDTQRLDAAIDAYRAQPSPRTAQAVHMAGEARRQELFRRLNQAPGGTVTMVRMRETLLQEMARPGAPADETADLAAVDADFAHLLASWFNRGFLVLRRIDWTTPANILERVMRYEAVHAIHGWDDLRRRLAPPDRLCFAFFHPQLMDEPLIFVEVALVRDIPDRIGDLLAEDRTAIAPQDADTAVFYSISNCQEGLRGVSFGNLLIKQVVEELRQEVASLKRFVTLSPVPGFAAWLAQERQEPTCPLLAPADRAALAVLDHPGWEHNADQRDRVMEPLMTAATWYLVRGKGPSGRPLDPVARFHLGNGARLERINFLGDLSPKGLKQAHGLMVNYLYKLSDIEENHERYAERREVVASGAVRRRLSAPENPPVTVAAAS